VDGPRRFSGGVFRRRVHHSMWWRSAEPISGHFRPRGHHRRAVKSRLRPVHPLGCRAMIRGPTMVAWGTVRSVVAVLMLLFATTEILACAAIASPDCPFSTHTSPDSDDGCCADGCLCCCGHIVVVAPIVPVASFGFVTRAVAFDACRTPDVPANRIEHPPRS
jgi:hypothetical protein